MSEQTITHNQAPATAEEILSARQTLMGIIDAYCNVPLDHVYSAQMAEAIDGQLAPQASQVLFNAASTGYQPNAQDMIAAMYAGAMQQAANAESMIGFLERGGRVAQGVVDTVKNAVYDRAGVRGKSGSVLDTSAYERGIADTALTSASTIYEPNSAESNVLYAFAAGVLAAHANESEYAQNASIEAFKHIEANFMNAQQGSY